MTQQLIDQHRVDAYLLGLLSPTEQHWIESCFDSDPAVQQLFQNRGMLPFHLQPEPELNDTESELQLQDDDHSFHEWLLQIDAELLAVAGIKAPQPPPTIAPTIELPTSDIPTIAYRRLVGTGEAGRLSAAASLPTPGPDNSTISTLLDWAEYETAPREFPNGTRVFLSGKLAQATVVKVTVRDKNQAGRPIFYPTQEFSVNHTEGHAAFVDLPLLIPDSIDPEVTVLPVLPTDSQTATTQT